MKRNGRLEDTYWIYSFAPLYHEGVVAGIFVMALDTTDKVLAAHRGAADAERLHSMFEQAPGFMAMLRGPEHIFELTNAAYTQLIGHRDVIGKPVREALPEVEGQGYFELLDNCLQTGEAFTGFSSPIRMPRTPGGALEERFVDFVYQPIRDAQGHVTGIFVDGYDVSERVEAEQKQKLLARELTHRVKNLFAVASGMVTLSARSAFGLDGLLTTPRSTSTGRRPKGLRSRRRLLAKGLAVGW